MREVSTTEALMTDPTTEEGRAYWQARHEHEEALERMSTETWQHLQAAHGFYDWTIGQLAEHYPSFAVGGLVDVAGLHQRDHQLDAGALDHDHQEVTPSETP